MQKAVGLNAAIYQAGGDPDKGYATVFVTISGPRDALSDLTPEAQEALLIGAFEGMDAALPDQYKVDGSLTYQEHMPIIIEPEQPARK